ncbi:MAG: T9SS type A sorting domain-containing protein [Ignavibacteriaceae bacterium]|nr:T9SS type A sorting domain-containing protein [Ignavibacteriaceae bacterium]
MEMAGLPKVDFINNIITANSNTVSGASLLRFLMGYYKFINNTIAENTSTYLASFTLSSNAQNSEAVFFNNIIWNTTVDTGFGFLSGNIKLFYNIVRGGFQGEGNLDTDPLFEAGDTLYSVQGASPALNAGRSSFSYNSAVINSPPDDYLRNLRPSPQGTNPDLGALELPPVASGIKLYDTQSFKYLLFQNYPNPFNPATKIRYQVPENRDQGTGIRVTLKIYDVRGREVATLVNEEKAPGSYKIEFNSSRVDNPRYKVISSGIYFYQLRAGNDVVITRKMILMK